MRRLRFALMLVVFVFPASTVLAQQSAPSQQPVLDPAAYAAAKNLMLATHSDEIARQMLPTLTKTFNAIIARDNPTKTAQLNQLMDQYFVPVFNARLAQLQDQIAIIYATNLTPDEMQKMTAFYQSPVGQKYLAAMPMIMQQTMAVSKVWGQQVAREGIQNLVEQLKKNNMNVPKELGL